jgi:hypothetical protein
MMRLLQKSTAVEIIIWTIQYAGTGDDKGYSVAVDPAGNIFTMGYFNYTTDFDPGPGVNNLISTGFKDAYLAKINTGVT